jgi:hypothetical protein
LELELELLLDELDVSRTLLKLVLELELLLELELELDVSRTLLKLEVLQSRR